MGHKIVCRFVLSFKIKKRDLKQEFSDLGKVALAFNIHASKLVKNDSEPAL